MSTRVTRYDVCDANGSLVAFHARQDLPEGRKKVWWEHPDGTPSKNGEIKPALLPLYGTERVAGWPSDAEVIVAEGEKATDALTAHGFCALGTVTGSSGCPVVEPLAVLRGRDVVLWPDNDETGRRHMDKVAGRLVGIATSMRVFKWAGAPKQGDAADYFTGPDAAVRLREELKTAMPWSPPQKADPTRLVEPRRRGQGTDLGLDDVEPAPDPVDGQTLFADLVTTLDRYVILPASATVAVALWIALT